jgi:hypothetical protein
MTSSIQTWGAEEVIPNGNSRHKIAGILAEPLKQWINQD